MYQPIALEIYRNILRHKLHRDVEVRPARFVIQPNLFWLVAAPSGLISDKYIPEQFGIVLSKTPRAKRNFDPFVLLQDSLFCVEKLDTDLLYLKQKHSDGYYEEIQVCMGLSGVFLSQLCLLHFHWTCDCKSKVLQRTLSKTHSKT